MSLEGAKLICLNDVDGSQGNIFLAHGRTFKFGYYMDCDVVLEHSDALGLHCTIDCDAFGRVTIENRCPEQTITLDGKTFKKMRPLLHNTEICMLGKKYLWEFEGNLQAGGFQSEDASDFATPSKKMKAEQPPMSEPARRWRTQYQKRLTIHSFAYSIKSGENAPAVEVTTDENKPLNTYERIISPIPFEPALMKRSSSPLATDLINLKTPKAKQKSFAGRKTPLSCCKLSETVITSYSPRETGVRPEKSFAIVQSPATSAKKSSALPDISLGPFQHTSSPLLHNYRSSMHLIDLTTPMKRVPLGSPSSTLLKSALKKNTPKVKPQQQASSIAETSMVSMDSTIYSVHSTDDSVIELSDEGSFSPSPVLKSPQRPRTPQSLMKRAILSSAKKAAVSKRLQQPPKPPPPTPSTPKNPASAANVRFQSQSTPQRKSLGRFQSPDERLKASQSVSGKTAKSMITSTPFRAGDSSATVLRRSSILRSPSTSLTGLKNKSRVSLMLTQALSKSPQTNVSQRRKSVTFVEVTESPRKSLTKGRKSVSFLDRIESEEVEENQTLNETFSLEDDHDDAKKADEGINTTSRKDATFSPEKDKSEFGRTSESKEVCSGLSKIVTSGETDNQSSVIEHHSKVISPARTEVSFISETPATRKDTKRLSGFKPLPGVNKGSPTVGKSRLNVTFSPDKDIDSIIPQAANEIAHQSTTKAESDTEDPQSKGDELKKTTQLTSEIPSTLQTPQSSRRHSKHIKSKPSLSAMQSASDDNLPDIVEDDDFEGLDMIFKTPKARNLMIMSSPKSISLQKPTTDSVELVHSTEYDLSASLDAIFKTPQSEFISNRVDVGAPDSENVQPFTPEEAFDMLVGRPISRRSYVRKPSPKKPELSSLNMSKDPTLPKTDIEEWIENVNESVEVLGGYQDDEDELSYLTATTQGEFCRDPLTMSSIAGSVSTTNEKRRNKSPIDESVMTIQEDDEEDSVENASALKDPLEMTVQTPKRSLSPNISGIDLLDHTSESLFSETLEVSDESSGENESEKTVGMATSHRDETITHLDGDIQISPDKARREMERAFANFEAERRIVESKRLVSTPEPKKAMKRVTSRRSMGNQPTLHGYFDVKALRAEREMEVAFEKFEKSPKHLVGARLAKTPELGKPMKKDIRKTMGNQLDLESSFNLEVAKAEREMELAFENFEEKPVFSKERTIQTPDPKKMVRKDNRRTMGSNMVSEVKLDLKAAKTQSEIESAFKNFIEKPTTAKERLVHTPHPKKGSLKDNRRSMGSNLVSEVNLDLKEVKAEREMELAFENFQEEPVFSTERVVQTPEPKKVSPKGHRRTMESGLVSKVTLDLEAAKAEREMELAFENFQEEPEFSAERVVKTPESKQASSKDHRRTMGSGLVSKVTLDLEAAKAEREMELAFENFEEEPAFSAERVVKTPEPKKASSKDHRRTMGSGLMSKITLDLEAAKAEREMKLAFENFEEEPEFSAERVAKTPELKKASSKDHRRTMGSGLVSKVTLDLEAAKAEREMELAFENFEEEPEFSAERVAKTPELKKASSKDHRRTMGSGLVSKVTLDLEAAKAEREMELAFENFEEEPEFSAERVVKTPEPKKASSKDRRRTMGSGLVSKVTLDLEAVKAEREMELAFENFQEEPVFSAERVVQTPEPKKVSPKGHRRTMESGLVSKVTLDLEAAKAEREMELAFENFQEEPAFSAERVAKTPEPKKASSKDRRRTMGSGLVSKVTLDLEAAKAEREMELAFENFQEEPEFSAERVAKTPEPKKASSKDRRRTMGSGLVSKVTLDLEAAKAEREMELAFENFQEEPEFSAERVAKTPEPKKASSKDHRRTMGSGLVSKVTLDLEVAKAEREMELAFENFEKEPEFSAERVAKTPEPKKASSKDRRRTMGSGLVSKVTLDLEAAKAERELELAFENFEEEPEFSAERVVKTPEPKKASSKDRRRTMGSGLVSKVTLDLEAAKAEREMELAFENFEEEPEFSAERVVKTPEPKKASSKDHRRTMGSGLVSKVTLDLEAAKAEREMELAFENFEKEPEFSAERVAKTPEPKKASSKDHRRTMGSGLVSKVTLDLEVAKAEREMELAFENFEEEPEFSAERVAKTPEPKKASSKDHRRTMGSGLVSKVTLDLEVAKAEREMELAFENFEEEPEFSAERVVKTPEPKKASSKDHRRTMGSGLMSKVTLDLEAAKAEREMELAFENFEEEPEFSAERVVKTPEPKKASSEDRRRTMGSGLMSKITLDLEAAKTEREMELAFENFEEEPEFSAERVVHTPEPKKASRNDHRRTMGSNLASDVKLDLSAAKAEREMELIFENFKEDTTVEVERHVKTPDPKKQGRSVGMSLGYSAVLDPSFDPHALKSEREEEQRMEEEIMLQKVTKNDYLEADREETVESQISSANEELQVKDEQLTVNQEVTHEKHQDGVLYKDNNAESIIERQDAVKSKIKSDGELLTPQMDTDNHPRSRKKRLNTIDAELKPEEKGYEESTPISTVQLRSLRRRRNTADEGERAQEFDEDIVTSSMKSQTQEMTTATPTISQPRSRRRRQNTIDGLERQQEGSTKTELVTPQDTQMKNRTGRQNSVDISSKPKETLEHHRSEYETDSDYATYEKTAADGDANLKGKELIEDEGESSRITSHATRKRRKKSTSEDDTNRDPAEDHNIAIDSTGVDSTDDEIKHTPSTRKKRLRKIVSIPTPSSQIVGEIHHNLEPIIEEEKRAGSPVLDQKAASAKAAVADDEIAEDAEQHKDAAESKTKQNVNASSNPLKRRKKSTSKDSVSSQKEENKLENPSKDQEVIEAASVKEASGPVRRRAGRKQASEQEEGLVNIKPELNEIIISSPIPSNNRIRGRKAQLNVVLIEQTELSATRSLNVVQVADAEQEDPDGEKSRTWQTLSVKMEPVEEVASETASSPTEEKSDQEIVQKITKMQVQETDVGDVIACTPAPSKERGRRLASKVESTEPTAAPALRRGRRGSTQQEHEEFVPSTPVLSKSRSKAVLKVEPTEPTSTPVRRRGRRGGNIEEDVEEEIPSTPLPSKTRGRRAVQKAEAADSAAESSTPAPKRGRRGAADKVKEVPSTTEDVTKSNADVPLVDGNIEDVIISAQHQESLSECLTPDVVQSTPVPLKSRRRKAALNIEPAKSIVEAVTDVHTTMSDVEEVVSSAQTLEHIPVMIETESATVADATEGVVPSLPLKTRGRKVAVKVEPVEVIAEGNVEDNVSSNQEPKNIRRGKAPLNEHVDSSAPSSPQVSTKPRGRRAALKAEPKEPAAQSSTPARRGRRRGAVEDEQEVKEAVQNSECIPVVEEDTTVEASTEEEHDIVVEAPQTKVEVPLPSKTRGRKAALKIEPVEPTAEKSTPARRGRRRGAVENEQEVKEAAQNSECIQVVKEDTTVEASTEEEHAVVVEAPQANVEEVVLSIPLPSKPRGRKAALKIEPLEPAAERSTPARKRARRGTVDTEVHAEEVAMDSSKTHELPAALTLEPAVSSFENSTPVRKIGRRGVVKEDPEVHTDEDDMNKIVLSKKRGRPAATHSETPVAQDFEAHTEEDENVVPSKRRGRAVPSKPASTESTTGNSTKRGRRGAVEHTGDLDSAPEKIVSSKRRAHPQVLKLEPADSASESSTPVRKRGRRGAIPEDTHEANKSDATIAVLNVVATEVSAAEVVPVTSRSRGRTARQKVGSTIENKKRGKTTINNLSVNQTEDEKSEEETTDSAPVEPEVEQKSSSRPVRSRRPSVKETKVQQVVSQENLVQSTEVTPLENKSQKKPIRSRRLLSEDEQTQSTNTDSEEKSEKKPVRGRRAALKKDTTSESTSHTEEEQSTSASKKKTTRSRVKADTSTEQSQVEEHKTTRGRKANTKADAVEVKVPPTEDEIEENPTRKPTRGKKAVQPKSKPVEEPVEEQPPSPAPTKGTRTRKAAISKVAKDTDDEQSQSEAPKKPTRSRKASEAAKDEEKAVPKRRNLRNMEVPTDDDTPSKRMRRKPNILLSDEFVC